MTSIVAPASRARATKGRSARGGYTVDLVLLSVVDGRLAVLLQREDRQARDEWGLPWEPAQADETLAAAAARLARERIGVTPGWLEQVGAFADGLRHAADAELSVGFVGLVPAGTEPPPALAGGFRVVDALPALAPRQRAMVDGAVALVRGRVAQAPVAFRLLPPTFTLSELQEIYELLLERRLHKASFRRSLQAARIVEPTDEWRTEGRGRPAQLFRHVARKRRRVARGVTFG